MSNEFKLNVGILQAVTCILGLDGEDGLARLAEELTVGLNPWSADSPEFALCRQDILFFDDAFVPAGGAGFRSIFQIHNDSADAIIVLEPGCYASAIGNGIVISRTSTLATADNGLVFTARDGRFPRPTVPYCRLRSQNGVALPAGFSNGEVWSTDTTPYETKWSTIIRPQGTIAFYPTADNVGIKVSLTGRVRRVNNLRELNP